MRVRAHAREGVIIVLFTIHLLSLSSCFFPLSLGYPKTTRRFMKNKPSFCEKQAVVLRKTSRRFAKNKPSFCEKQAIGSSNTHLNRKETSDASQETSDIFL